MSGRNRDQTEWSWSWKADLVLDSTFCLWFYLQSYSQGNDGFFISRIRGRCCIYKRLSPEENSTDNMFD